MVLGLEFLSIQPFKTMAFFALAESTWQIAHTLSARRRCIRWSWFGREENSGSGDKNQSLPKKGLFFTFSGRLSQKTLARVYKQVFGETYSGLGTTRLLLCHHGCSFTLGIAPGYPFSLASSGYREGGSNAFTFFVRPDMCYKFN